MEMFVNTAGFVAAISLGIMVLTLFFKTISYISGRRPVAISDKQFRGLLEGTTQLTVYLRSGKTLQDVRLLGFVEHRKDAQALPWEIQGMAVFESQQGNKYFTSPKEIRLLEAKKT